MPRNIDSNFCGSFTWTIVSYKLCFAAIFMLTIQITIFTFRPLAEKFKDYAFCPNFFRIIFIINGVAPVSDFNRWAFVIDRQCISFEQGN